MLEKPSVAKDRANLRTPHEISAAGPTFSGFSRVMFHFDPDRNIARERGLQNLGEQIEEVVLLPAPFDR